MPLLIMEWAIELAVWFDELLEKWRKNGNND